MRKSILFFTFLFYLTASSQDEQNFIAVNKHRQYNTFLHLGLIHYKEMQYEKAILYFDSASTVFPHFHKPYEMAGMSAVKMGLFQEAYNYFVKLILTGTPFYIEPQVLEYFPLSSYYTLLINQKDSLYQKGMQKFDTKFIISFVHRFTFRY